MKHRCSTGRRCLVLVLVLLLTFQGLVGSAAAATDVQVKWTKDITSGSITATATDEYGTRFYAGTSDGKVYCFDASGTQIWSSAIKTGYPVAEIVLTDDGTKLAARWTQTALWQDARNYVRVLDTSSGATLYDLGDPIWYGIKSHTITGSPDGDLYDYPMRFKVYRAAGQSTGSTVYTVPWLRPDWSELAFMDSSGHYLPLAIEENTGGTDAGGEYRYIWVKIPYIPKSPGTATIYIAYVNDAIAAHHTSNIWEDWDATFLLSDRFNEASINTTKWTVTGSGSATQSGGVLTVQATSGSDIFVYSPTVIGEMVEVVTRLKTAHYASTYYKEALALTNDQALVLSGFSYDIAEWNNKYGIRTQSGVLQTTDITDWSANTYYVHAITRFFKANWTTNGGVPTSLSGAAYPTATITRLQFNTRQNGARLDVDWVFIRPRTTNEPTHGTYAALLADSHMDYVQDIDITPDGKYLAITRLSHIEFWDITTGQKWGNYIWKGANEWKKAEFVGDETYPSLLATDTAGTTIYKYNNQYFSPATYTYSSSAPAATTCPLLGDGPGKWRNCMVIPVSSTSGGTQTNVVADFTLNRLAGTSSGTSIYLNDQIRDYNDIYITGPDGTPWTFYFGTTDGVNGTLAVTIPTLTTSAQNMYLYFNNELAGASPSTSTYPYILRDDFDGSSLNTTLWTPATDSGTITVENGYVDLYVTSGSPSGPAGYAQITLKQSFNYPVRAVYNVAMFRRVLYSGADTRNYLPRFVNGWEETGVCHSTTNKRYFFTNGDRSDWSEWADGTYYKHTFDYVPSGTSTWTIDGITQPGNNQGTGLSSATPFFRAGTTTNDYIGGRMRIDYFYVYKVAEFSVGTHTKQTYNPYYISYNPTPTATRTGYDGALQDWEAALTADWIAFSTANKLYIQQVTYSGHFGVTYTGTPTMAGTAGDVAIAEGGVFAVEGRSLVLDVWRIDAYKVGTYTTGGTLVAVDVAKKNALWVAAGGGDGKVYIFSKDAASSWYVYWASDAMQPVTDLSMTWRGEYVFAGRSDGTVTLYYTGGVPAVGYLIHVFKDGLPYVGTIQIFNGGADQSSWVLEAQGETDSYGTFSVSLMPGNYYRVEVDGESKIIMASSSRLEYTITLEPSSPVRSKLTYKSTYDPSTSTLYLSYEDTENLTTAVRWQVYRMQDQTLVYDQVVPVSGPTVENWTVNQTNTSYRVKMTASRTTGTFSNAWGQMVGSGAAPLPPEVGDPGIQLGIWWFVILFVGGLFSFLGGPEGAVIVSLLAGFLVLIGWLPLAPATAVMVIVWAFLGLFGRKGGEQ